MYTYIQTSIYRWSVSKDLLPELSLWPRLWELPPAQRSDLATGQRKDRLFSVFRITWTPKVCRIIAF